jgi:hypothetical protein
LVAERLHQNPLSPPVARRRDWASARQLQDLDADAGSVLRAPPTEHLDEAPVPPMEQQAVLQALPMERQGELPVLRRCRAEPDSAFGRVPRRSHDPAVERVGQQAASVSRGAPAAHLRGDWDALGPTPALLRRLAIGSSDPAPARLPRLDWAETVREHSHRSGRRRVIRAEDR